MAQLGSWKIDDLVTFGANTHDPSTGAAANASTGPTYRVYEDETATPILTGSMAALDAAGTTGFYTEQITLSAANGFEKGKSYTIYIIATVAAKNVTMHHNLQVEQVTRETLEGTVESGTISMTLAQVQRVLVAAAAGKLSGAGTATVAIRDINDTKDRISATVSSGNRSAVTIVST